MPQFELDETGDVDGITFDDLSPFVQGYIECMFFINTASGTSMVDWDSAEVQDRIAEGQIDGVLPTDASFSDLHPNSLDVILRECTTFEVANARWLHMAYALVPGSENYRYAKTPLDRRRAGQLFHYASNGHGVSWTDDGDAKCLQYLQHACRDRQSFDFSFFGPADDSPTGYGWVYVE